MVRIVAWHEFLFTIKCKSFYLVTFGMPVILVIYAGFIGFIALLSAPNETKKLERPVGIIDRSGLLIGPAGPLSGLKTGETHQDQRGMGVNLEGLTGPLSLDQAIVKRYLKRFDDLETAQLELQNESLGSVVVVPQDYLQSGTLEQFLRDRPLIGTVDETDYVEELLTEAILKRSALTPQELTRAREAPKILEFELGEDGGFVPFELMSKLFSLGIPMAVAALLIVALMMNGSLLLASVAEEKENKVMEVILSAVTAEDLLFGKVLGLVAAGLLQISVWLAMISVVPMLTMILLNEQIDYRLQLGQLALGCLFVVLGFVFYGCLLAGLGSMGSTYKDAQQLTVAVILCACVPLMTWMNFMNEPNGMVARVLSIVPLFSPGAMMLRLGISPVPWWEVVLSLAVLLLSIKLAVRLSAKLFRIGTLMYGKKPGPREIWRALRQPT